MCHRVAVDVVPAGIEEPASVVDGRKPCVGVMQRQRADVAATAVAEKLDRMLLRFDRTTGRILWQQVVAHGPLEKLNPQNSYASGTPATDGKRVYVTFRVGKDIVVAAHDPADGRQLWLVQPGTQTGERGSSNEPVLFADKIIIDGDSKGDSFLIALNNSGSAYCDDAATGQVVWRAKLGMHHASPVLVDGLVYFINDDGQVNVIKPNTEFQRVAQYEMGDSMKTTPEYQGKIPVDSCSTGPDHFTCEYLISSRSSSWMMPTPGAYVLKYFSWASSPDVSSTRMQSENIPAGVFLVTSSRRISALS